MEKLKSFTIGKKRYPYKIDLLVLEELQKEYANISQFEMQLKGWRPKWTKNDDGKAVIATDDNGMPQMEKTAFSMHAINTILPLMVNEGLEMEAEAKGREYEPVDAKELIRSLKMSPYEVQQIVVEEFDRCFDAKK